MSVRSPVEEQIERAFTYHPPKAGQPERYAMLRDGVKQIALMMKGTCPPSRELSLALTKLEEAVMWANAAISRHE